MSGIQLATRYAVCMRIFLRLTALSLCVFAIATGSSQSIHGRSGITLPPPPDVQPTPVTDDYSGTKIVDNYRWLEDEKSDATNAFIDAQNAYTDRYFKQDRIFSQIPDQLGALIDVTETDIPTERNGNFYFMRRLAGEQQYSIYFRRGLAGKDVRLLDPAVISRDPNTSIALYDVSRDGSLLLYAVKQGGADEAGIHVFNLNTKKTLVDELPRARYFSTSFAPDGKSFYYTRYNKDGTLLYQHVLGERPSHDQLIFGHEFRGEALAADDLISGHVTDDGRYLVVQIDRGVPARRVDIVFRDLTKKASYFDVLVWGLDSRFSAIYAHDAWYVKTDYKSPLGRILRADPGVMPEAWKTIVPEGKEVIDEWSIVGGKLYVKTLKDVVPQIYIYTLDGKPAGQVEYEGIGSGSVIYGKTTDRYGYCFFSSMIVPPSVYRFDTTTGKRELFFQAKIPFDSSQYQLKQVFFKSKDGTQVPMFIAGKKGLKLDGSERLLMTGYGGFNVSLLADWNSQFAWWLEQGGWFAIPNLRGGGEYGEQWHEQGMFEKKQNVFDDWFAAAQFLIDNKYTSPAHFAIIGRSNGGLLMGASMTQHPELFGAIECGYPLLDMLRYQKFKVGSFWITEYGSADNEKQFPYLLKYSPYQNVKVRDDYPAILFFTGDSDTRVDPLHARKMTALMQSASKSGRPILLHYGRGGGHSSGVSIDQEIDDYAMELAFLWTETGQSAKPR